MRSDDRSDRPGKAKEHQPMIDIATIIVPAPVAQPTNVFDVDAIMPTAADFTN